MIMWVAIGILVVLGLFLIKMEHHSRKVKLVIIVLIGALIYFSVVGLFSSDRVDLTSPSGIMNAAYVYVGWIGETSVKLWDVGKNSVKMVGNAVRFNQTEEQQQKRRR
jgi:hypothetical protein